MAACAVSAETSTSWPGCTLAPTRTTRRRNGRCAPALTSYAHLNRPGGPVLVRGRLRHRFECRHLPAVPDQDIDEVQHPSTAGKPDPRPVVRRGPVERGHPEPEDSRADVSVHEGHAVAHPVPALLTGRREALRHAEAVDDSGAPGDIAPRRDQDGHVRTLVRDCGLTEVQLDLRGGSLGAGVGCWDR